MSDKKINQAILRVSERLSALAKGNAVVSKPITMDDKHVVPICSLSLAFGGGGGTTSPLNRAAGDEESGAGGAEAGELERGSGQGAGGGAKAKPVAVIIVDGSNVKVESVIF